MCIRDRIYKMRRRAAAPSRSSMCASGSSSHWRETPRRSSRGPRSWPRRESSSSRRAPPCPPRTAPAARCEASAAPSTSGSRRATPSRGALRRRRRKAPREGVARREPLVEGAALASHRAAGAVRGGHGGALRELELSLRGHERGPREERRGVSRQCDEEPLAHMLDRDGAAARRRILYILSLIHI